MTDTLPYKIAALCYLFDASGRTLLLHRRRPPNQHLYSPVGGKLEQHLGESPNACALREISEETGLTVRPDELHLTGIISEAAYQNECHWLMFLYEVTPPVTLENVQCPEGTLEWYSREEIEKLAIPQTDRYVIWPLFWRYRRRFFTAHIDCTGQEMTWRLEQPPQDATEDMSLSLGEAGRVS